MAQAFFFDAVESDDRLAFRRRGREPVTSIAAEQLLPLNARSGEAWRERRTQEVELPERLGVVYMDRDADYQQGLQSAKRVALPLGAVQSRHQASLQLAMALEATTAKRIAEVALATAWLGRSSYAAALPTDWLRLGPTDVVDVVLPSGTQCRMRLGRVDVGADFSLRLEGVSETVARYVSAAVADAGQGRPVQLITGEAAWGAAVNALGNPRSPFATDEDNSLTVIMTTGGERLESVTQQAMLNGANAAVLINVDGEPEVIQFHDVTLNPDGSFTLTGLLRGRRGTDVFAHDHQPGELFVLLDPDDVETLLLQLESSASPASGAPSVSARCSRTPRPSSRRMMDGT